MIKVKLAFLGHFPYVIDTNRIINWKSKLFEINNTIDSYTITVNSDLDYWRYSDKIMESQLPKTVKDEIFIAITNLPLEDNFYVRIFSLNRICLTYYEMGEILNINNIPLENLILKIVYSLALVHKRFDRIPLFSELFEKKLKIVHDEARGCIFDMNGIKTDVIYSTNKPKICSACVEDLTQERVEKNVIENVQNELKKIKRESYYQLIHFIKRHPYWALCISGFSALVIGIIGSLIASTIYELLK